MKTQKMLNISFVFIVLSNFALGQIKVNGFVETGWMHGGLIIYQNESSMKYIYPNKTFYLNANFDVNWKWFHVSQDMNNNFCYDKGKSMTSLNIEFITNFSVQIKNIEFGYRHACLHPIVNDPYKLNYEYIRSSSDRVYFKLKW